MTFEKEKWASSARSKLYLPSKVRIFQHWRFARYTNVKYYVYTKTLAPPLFLLPDRLYVVVDGVIEFQGKVGPMDYIPEEVEEWLRANVGPPGKKEE